MGQLLLLLVVALTVAAVVFGVTVLVTGSDPGLAPVEPDGRAVPLPGTRPLVESDVAAVRFDTGLRGYRMAQVDQAMRRAAYDIGYKDELIGVLEAEVAALREGRTAEADVLRRAREAALAPAAQKATEPPEPGAAAVAGTADQEARSDDGVPATEPTDPPEPPAAAAGAATPPDAATDSAPVATEPGPTSAHPASAAETVPATDAPASGESGTAAPRVAAATDRVETGAAVPATGSDDPPAPAANGATIPSRLEPGGEPAADEGALDSVTRAETPEDGRVSRPEAGRREDVVAERSGVSATADARAERP